MKKRKIISLLCVLSAAVLVSMCCCVFQDTAGKQRYEITNFFHADFFKTPDSIIFPYKNNIYRIHRSEANPEKIYEQYHENQLLDRFSVSEKSMLWTAIYDNKLVITPSPDNTALIYGLGDHFQLIKKQPMAGGRFLGYLDGIYVYLSRTPQECILLMDEEDNIFNLTEAVSQAFHDGKVTEVQNSKYIIYESDKFICIGSDYIDDDRETHHLSLDWLYSKASPQNGISLTAASGVKNIAVDTKNERLFFYADRQKTLGCIENGIYREISMLDIKDYRKSDVNIAFKDGVFYFLLQKIKGESQDWGDYNLNQANLICDALYAFDTATETGKFLYETPSNQERIIGCKQGLLYLLDTKTGDIFQLDANGKVLVTTVSTQYPCMYATSYDGKTVVWGEEKLSSENPVLLAVL